MVVMALNKMMVVMALNKIMAMLSADDHDNNVLTMFNVLNGFKKGKSELRGMGRVIVVGVIMMLLLHS